MKKILFGTLIFGLFLNAYAYAEDVYSKSQFICSNEIDQKLIDSININYGVKMEQFESALKNGANPNWTSSTKNPVSVIEYLLLISCGDVVSEKDLLKCLNLLFEYGAKLNYNDTDAVYFAVANGYPSVVALFIEKGINPNMKINNESLVEIAIENDQQNVAKLLIARGAQKINKNLGIYLRLCNAISRNEKDEVREILKQKIDLNQKTPDNNTALGAWSRGLASFHLDILSMLLKNGADPNLKFDPKFRDMSNDVLPMQIFIMMTSKRNLEQNEHIKKVMRLLFKYGAHASGKDSYGKTPLHYAAQSNNIIAAKVLLANGANVNSVDVFGKKPIDYAESSEMIKILDKNKNTIPWVVISLSVICLLLFLGVVVLFKKMKI